MLSICIPTYNTDCSMLLDLLAKQIAQLEETIEVLVCDDFSTHYVDKNREACERNGFSFFENTSNLGSISTRIKLAKKSSFNWLLFVDSDMIPVHNKYLLNYISNIKSASVIFGGYRYKKDYRKTQLRKNYGISREEKSAKKRSQKPFKYVFSGNMLIEKEIFTQIINDPSNCYGYDLLLGERFNNNKVKLLHIDNGTFHLGIEDNISYLNNQVNGVKLLRTWFENDEINSDHNNLIKAYKVLEKMCLSKILFSPTLKLHVIIRKILIKFGRPIVLLDWFKLYHFVNAK
ncbi:MAG: glycosyltransferase [Flavobacteriaceae bacterium]|nr:glycosyltransferase [Flavobacteriaceae bacterium]